MPIEELELLIRITLATNPNIQEDSSMPEHYQTAKKKRKVYFRIARTKINTAIITGVRSK